MTSANRNHVPASRARLPRREREQQMIEVATIVFGRLGYHGASMDQIAEEAGISKPMLYAYFESKEGLYAACLRNAADGAVAALRGAYVPDEEPERQLLSGFNAFFTFLRENPSAWQLIRRDGGFDAETEELGDNARDELRDTIDDLLRTSSRKMTGDPFGDSDRRAVMSHALLGTAEAMAAWWFDNKTEASVDGLNEHAMNLFWLGIGGLASGQTWNSPVARSVH